MDLSKWRAVRRKMVQKLDLAEKNENQMRLQLAPCQKAKNLINVARQQAMISPQTDKQCIEIWR